jgi:glycosyltransferase involved in cell wall biosynthesis
MPTLAFLGPEIPALSATFVYEELLDLERRGVSVRAFTVRRPAQVAVGQAELARRTEVIYDHGPLALVFGGLVAVALAGRRALVSLGWLVADMVEVGLHRLAAWKLLYQWLAGARLAYRLQRHGCSHLHVHFAHTPAQIAMYASGFSGIPFTITAHANDIFERGLLLACKARRSTKMLTISEFNREFLLSLGIPADKLAVVRCGVAFGRRPEMAHSSADAVFRIGTLCRLVEKKGVDDLLRALVVLRAEAKPVSLVIVGEGPQRDGLWRLCRELGLEHSVEFKGAMEHEAVVEWLRSLDAFVLACKKDGHGDMDGIPVALMEAMSQAIPVVSTRLSGIPELVVHEQTGLLASPADPDDLARQIRRLMSDPSLRASLATAGTDHVRAEFAQDVNLNRLLSYICPSLRVQARSAAPAPTS